MTEMTTRSDSPELAARTLASAANGAGVEVVTPAHAGWDAARTVWNLSMDLQPAAVALPTSPEDVRLVVSLAGRLGFRVAAVSTGHNVGPLGDLSDTVLVRMHGMREVTVDPDARTATVAGGAVWDDVTRAVAPHGLVALAGSSHDVGVAGYVLGGGVSWLARSHGLAANTVRSLDVVTADGVLRSVDADNDSELFWAIRGGAGNLGVVTGMTLELFPLTHVVAGSLFFPLQRLGEVLTVWRSWVAELPESVTSSVRALRVPPLPDIPEPLRGQAFAVVNGAIQEDPEVAARILAPLRDLGPVMDNWEQIEASRLSEIHMDPPGPVPGRGDGTVIDELAPELVDRIVELAGPDATDCALLQVELRTLGGAAGRPHPRGGAVDHLGGRFTVFTVGIAPEPVQAAVVEAQVAEVMAATEPWRSEREYLNMSEVARPGGCFHDETTLARLREVRTELDPDGVMRANHDVLG